MHWQKNDELEKIIEPHLVGTINFGSLKMFMETTKNLLEEMGFDRTSMGDVLWNLEYAFQLQEISMQNDLDENSTNHIADVPVRYPDTKPFGPSSI